ncbi:hypothetical protein C1752_13130 [Acaryochloris thomasi RCC1774]|uniref:Uncharacterized protein n=2 Tax=Acaryochloris TaxID=155977 RepID=A0A2W1JJG7_9CYAN|nr:hypothetical protein C1752_13130 [Acaryochloris thomasi RCC1774]
MMQQEFTTQEHINADGVLLLNVPELKDKDVEVVVRPIASAALETEPQPESLAKALEGLIGVCSFEPDDLSEHTSETYAALLARDYDQTQQ